MLRQPSLARVIEPIGVAGVLTVFGAMVLAVVLGQHEELGIGRVADRTQPARLVHDRQVDDRFGQAELDEIESQPGFLGGIGAGAHRLERGDQTHGAPGDLHGGPLQRAAAPESTAAHACEATSRPQ